MLDNYKFIRMISFYPGPSKIDPKVKSYINDAFQEQIIEYNHRSPQFMHLMKSCISILKDKLSIPKNYSIIFTSSATECWEICNQSFSLPFIHIYNGAFGKKWATYNKGDNVRHFPYSIHKRISIKKISKRKNEKNILCLTNCETSNTTKINAKTINKIRARYKKSLIFVDATSAMGGTYLNWNSADIWFASVQKCFGLPSGMAIMVCSPNAIQNMDKEDFHYNSLNSAYNNGLQFQTTHTPNILNIYLLKRLMENRLNIKKEHEIIKKRALLLKKVVKNLGLSLLTQNNNLQSETVIGIKCTPDFLVKIKQSATKHNILLGNGYGPWKNNSFRIANFPAHTDEDFDYLIDFLNKF